MRIHSRKLFNGLLATALFSAGGAQAATSIYAPFSFLNSGRTQWTGLWLADVGNLGAAPIQLTNQALDGPAVNSGAPNVAVLDTWTYNASTSEATNVQAELVVYGLGGKLYKASLQSIPAAQPFSNGSYAELCSATALDPAPYTATGSYVQVVVEPVGSSETCASGLGTQTWLIPASADGSVTPAIEPANWSVLGAFTDNSGNFNRWLVWSGSAVLAYMANFTEPTTLLVGPPAGPAPQVMGRQTGYAILQFPSDSGGVHTDTLYQVSMLSGGEVGSFSYSDTSPCASQGYSLSVVADSATRELLFSEPTNTGYAVYRVGVGGGAVSNVYADSSGNVCGNVASNNVATGGYVAIDAYAPATGISTVLSVREGGPVTQTPVLLAGSATVYAEAVYTLDGRIWILEFDSGASPNVFDTLVVAGDGTVIEDYGNSLMRYDLWNGFYPAGMPPVDRTVVNLYIAAAGGSCGSGALTSINAASFAATPISGLPAVNCDAGAYGWAPASVGYVQVPTGTQPAEIDPVGGKLYSLLGPVTNGYFLNVASVSGYPFF